MRSKTKFSLLFVAAGLLPAGVAVAQQHPDTGAPTAPTPIAQVKPGAVAQAGPAASPVFADITLEDFKKLIFHGDDFKPTKAGTDPNSSVKLEAFIPDTFKDHIRVLNSNTSADLRKGDHIGFRIQTDGTDFAKLKTEWSAAHPRPCVEAGSCVDLAALGGTLDLSNESGKKSVVFFHQDPTRAGQAGLIDQSFGSEIIHLSAEAIAKEQADADAAAALTERKEAVNAVCNHGNLSTEAEIRGIEEKARQFGLMDDALQASLNADRYAILAADIESCGRGSSDADVSDSTLNTLRGKARDWAKAHSGDALKVRDLYQGIALCRRQSVATLVATANAANAEAAIAATSAQQADANYRNAAQAMNQQQDPARRQALADSLNTLGAIAQQKVILAQRKAMDAQKISAKAQSQIEKRYDLADKDLELAGKEIPGLTRTQKDTIREARAINLLEARTRDLAALGLSDNQAFAKNYTALKYNVEQIYNTACAKDAASTACSEARTEMMSVNSMVAEAQAADGARAQQAQKAAAERARLEAQLSGATGATDANAMAQAALPNFLGNGPAGSNQFAAGMSGAAGGAPNVGAPVPSYNNSALNPGASPSFSQNFNPNLPAQNSSFLYQNGVLGQRL